MAWRAGTVHGQIAVGTELSIYKETWEPGEAVRPPPSGASLATRFVCGDEHEPGAATGLQFARRQAESRSPPDAAPSQALWALCGDHKRPRPARRGSLQQSGAGANGLADRAHFRGGAAD